MRFEVKGQSIVLTEREELVSGTANVYTAEFGFDSAWNGYAVSAVFEGCGVMSGRVRREMLVEGGKCTVPWETLLPGGYLRVGVYGVDGERRLPTIYAERQFVSRGTESAEGGTDYTPPLAEQILAQTAEDRLAAESAAERAEAAAAHQPYPDPGTGTWWVWDSEAGEYADSGESTGGVNKGAVLELMAENQADWAENDEASPGYVKNRPFWGDISPEAIIAEEKVRVMAGLAPVEFEPLEPFEDGATYIAVIDDDGSGNEVSQELVYTEQNGGSGYYTNFFLYRDGARFGSLDVWGNYEGIAYPDYQGKSFFTGGYFGFNMTSVNVKIIRQEMLKGERLPEKYMPLSVNGQKSGDIKATLTVNFTRDDSGEWTADMTYDEICAALDAGYSVMGAADGMTLPCIRYDTAVVFCETPQIEVLDNTYMNIYAGNYYVINAGGAYGNNSKTTTAIPTVPFYGATAEEDGSIGLVPAPEAGDEGKFLRGDGTWAEVSGSGTGEDGYSPSAAIEQTDTGAVITVTDKAGTTTAVISNGKDGDDYVLTDGDRSEIAALAAELVPSGGGGDISLGISGAEVGQIVKITGVDDEGKPTSWISAEAHPKTTLFDFTLEESASQIKLLIDDEKKALLESAEKITISMTMPLNPDQTARGSLTLGIYSERGWWPCKPLNAAANTVPAASGYEGEVRLGIVRGPTKSCGICVGIRSNANYTTTPFTWGGDLRTDGGSGVALNYLTAETSTEFYVGTTLKMEVSQ